MAEEGAQAKGTHPMVLRQQKIKISISAPEKVRSRKGKVTKKAQRGGEGRLLAASRPIIAVHSASCCIAKTHTYPRRHAGRVQINCDGDGRVTSQRAPPPEPNRAAEPPHIMMSKKETREQQKHEKRRKSRQTEKHARQAYPCAGHEDEEDQGGWEGESVRGGVDMMRMKDAWDGAQGEMSIRSTTSLPSRMHTNKLQRDEPATTRDLRLHSQLCMYGRAPGEAMSPSVGCSAKNKQAPPPTSIIRHQRNGVEARETESNSRAPTNPLTGVTRNHGAEAKGGPFALDLGGKRKRRKRTGGGSGRGGSGGEREKREGCGKREKVGRAQEKARSDTDTDTETDTTLTMVPAGHKSRQVESAPVRYALLAALHSHCIRGRPSAAKRSTRDGAILSRPYTLHLPLSTPHPVPSPPNQTRHIPSRSHK
ncbi:hypothetical protein B0H14DRAFT_2612340 [Mycena olivaceomarginata]|nr:hypothetical protein B0H14DRAFT_2612340 [Mycena olivaceomarginata]